MKGQIVWRVEIGGLPIELIQYGPDRVAIQYWKQRKGGLTYREVAKELGTSILHALACAGEIDERGIHDQTRFT